ncbi:hypothetical protein NC652_012670 [Populus alba x Populus x berolinensis]|nr:hypothetical protein NC652_012670 [Populus alba x Populus x berolinensis]
MRGSLLLSARSVSQPLCLSSLAMNSISEGVSWSHNLSLYKSTFSSDLSLVSLEVFEAKILFLVLDNAGETTLLYMLKDEAVSSLQVEMNAI